METAEERKSLGQVIRALRELEGMSRAELGNKAGLGVDMIAKVEQGAKSPSTKALQRLAGVFGVDAVELSSRGQVWADLLQIGEGSTALLRQVASGASAAGVRQGAMAGVAGAVLGAAGLPISAAAAVSAAAPLAVTAAIARNRRNRLITEEIRLALIERLAQAQTEEDLLTLAEALKTVVAEPFANLENATPIEQPLNRP